MVQLMRPLTLGCEIHTAVVVSWLRRSNLIGEMFGDVDHIGEQRSPNRPTRRRLVASLAETTLNVRRCQRRSATLPGLTTR